MTGLVEWEADPDFGFEPPGGFPGLELGRPAHARPPVPLRANGPRLRVRGDGAGQARRDGGPRGEWLGARRGAVALVLGALLATPVAAQAAGPTLSRRYVRRRSHPGQGAPRRWASASTPPASPARLGRRWPRRPRIRRRRSPRCGGCARRHAPFTLRLNRLFWSEHGAGIARFARLARRYIRHGYRVEVQVRYHPDAEPGGENRGLGRLREARDAQARLDPRRHAACRSPTR